MDDNKQAVVDETKVSATPDTAVDSARKDDSDIDALLAEFDQKTQATASPPETKTKTEELPAPEWAKNILTRIANEEVKKVSDDIFEGLEVSERVKNSYLDSYAREYPAARAAFENKERDPRTWARWQKVIKGEAQKELSHLRKVDSEATADRDAVAAAVRGASTKVAAEPAPRLGEMSDNELRNYTYKNFGFV